MTALKQTAIFIGNGLIISGSLVLVLSHTAMLNINMEAVETGMNI